MTKYMERNKILVVDDEEDLCEILQFNLESEGFAVDIANSAEEALKLLTDEHELILLDVMMEGMSGFKMAEKVRKEMHMNTPIIFLTAKDTENDMLTGFSIGGDDYIAKPFNINILLMFSSLDTLSIVSFISLSHLQYFQNSFCKNTTESNTFSATYPCRINQFPFAVI